MSVNSDAGFPNYASEEEPVRMEGSKSFPSTENTWQFPL